MNWMNLFSVSGLKSAGTVIKKSTVKHMPEIMIGFGLAGMISSLFMVGAEAPKASKRIQKRKKELSVKKLPVKEIIKVTWKGYAIPAATTIASVGCIIGGTRVSLRRSAVLATAYSLSERALTDYKEKVIETIGEKKEKTVRDKVAQSKVDKYPADSANNSVIVTGKGTLLCFDAVGGQYFRSDAESIKKVVNELNSRLISEMYMSLNEFYYAMGLENTTLGDDLGWNIDDGLIDLDMTSRLTKDMEPCLVINYRIAPRYGYDKLG